MFMCPVSSPSLNNSLRWANAKAKPSASQVWLTASWLDYSVYSSVVSLKSEFTAAYLKLMLNTANRTSVYCRWMYGEFFQAEYQQHLIQKPDRFLSCDQQDITAMHRTYIPSIVLYLGSTVWLFFFFSLSHRWLQCDMLIHSKLSYSYPCDAVMV